MEKKIIQQNKSHIKFGELIIDDVMMSHIVDCVENNWVSMGVKTTIFERMFEKIMKTKNAVAVSSGTAGVCAACRLLFDFGATPSSEIIVPALSFIATSSAVVFAGLKCRFVEVGWDMNINVEEMESKINSRTIAVIAVGTMGLPPNLIKLQQICKKHGLFLIEDACENYGARHHGKLTNKYSDVSVSSHYVGHQIVMGEGGVVYTDNNKYAQTIKSIRSHGRKPDTLYFDHVRLGFNFKPNDLCASIGIGMLKKFWDNFSKRKKIWQQLVDKSKEFSDKFIFSEDNPPINIAAPHGFSMILRKKNKKHFKKLIRLLNTSNITWKRNFGCIPTQHKAFSDHGYIMGDFPISEHIGSYGCHVGTHQYMDDENVDRIINCIREV